jgi:hypothetical protein
LHADQLDWLCALASGACEIVPERAVPLALDRFGLRVRFTGNGVAFDVRFEFRSPVRGPEELHRAMHSLFEAAYGVAHPEPS